IPLGVGVVISPWNFLFAIMAGTTSAAMVSGNTVLLKPASTTPVIAHKFVEVLEEAGMPNGVVNFIPGSGSEVGDYLVDHPRTRFVSFTGSREVGTRIFERSAVVHEDKGQKWLKRAIIEMGGKDTIIVDADADLDLAAESIVTSAFGFSGQKCSACSRAVIHEDVYDEVAKRIVDLTNEKQAGDPASNEFYTGPVIEQAAFDKISSYIEIGKEEGELLAGGDGDDSNGWFIQPTVFGNVAPDARIMQEEIFGPVVALSKVSSFDEAIEVANNTDYGLTGSVITNNRKHMEQARRDFFVGNLYFNRGCTAAIVGYHPFGGFNMSGTIQKQADQAIYYTICKVKQHQKCFSKIYVEGLDMDNPARDFFINLSENKLVNSAAKRWSLKLGTERVVAGYTIEEMIETIKELNNKVISCTIDNLGEFVCEQSEAIEAKNQILHVIEAISTHQVDAHVSLKPSQLGLDIDYDFTYANLEEIAQLANKYDIFINIDMEGHKHLQRSFDLLTDLHKKYKNIGTVIQAYFYRAEEDLARLTDYRLRIVKGAYKEAPEV